MAAFFNFIDAVNALQVTFEAVGVAAHFEQKVPLPFFQNRSAPASSICRLGRSACPLTMMPTRLQICLYLLELVRREHDRQAFVRDSDP